MEPEDLKDPQEKTEIADHKGLPDLEVNKDHVAMTVKMEKPGRKDHRGQED